MLYPLYQMGAALANWLPRKLCYQTARAMADGYSAQARRDWEAVRANLEVVLGNPRVPPEQVREVFRNFGMYLVDFFRFGRLTQDSVRRMVRFEGLQNIEEAMRRGKGLIGASAHLGNYELAGAVLAMLGMPVSGVVLTHQNPQVDRFFRSQRARVGVQSIPVQQMARKDFLEASLSVLRNRGVLGLVADRDYFNRGIPLPMFGKVCRLPTGPAWFSLKTGAPVVPTFLVREPDGNFRMITEKPLQVPVEVDREQAVWRITEEWSQRLAQVIRRYPTQWYMFQEFWRTGPAVIR